MPEPVDLAEAKLQVRMENDDSEDTFLESLIAPARAFVERRSRIFFVGGARSAVFQRWGDYLEIYRQPISAVGTITYGPDGTGTEYADAQVNLGGFPLRIYPASDGAGFPELADGETITVPYTAGAVAADSEEYLIGKRAILFLIGLWFDNRGERPLTKDEEFVFDCILDEISPLSAY